MMKLAWEHIHINEKANAMLDDIVKIIGKQKLWLRYLDCARIIRTIFGISFGVYAVMYLFLCCLFNFSPTYIYNVLMFGSFVGTIILTIISSLISNKYSKLEYEYQKLWQQYEEFKKENNLN